MADAKGLRSVLRSLSEETAEGVRAQGLATRVVLTLPTLGRRPIGSWETLAETAGEEVRFEPWSVPALTWELPQLVPLLADLPRRPETPGVRIGPGLLYLMELGRFALDLLSRERFLPSMDRQGPGRSRALWRAALSTDQDLARSREFAGSLPPVLLAGSPPKTVFSRQEVVQQLLDHAVDGLARVWLQGTGTLKAEREFPEDHWVEALGSPRPFFRSPEGPATEIDQALRTWSAQALAPAGGGVRTCLRLDPPGREEDDRARSILEAPEGRWWLRVFLQDRSDPSLLVPSRAIYASGAATLERDGKVLSAAPEQLLADLARAARLWPPLAKLLDTARPEACSLSISEAYRFVKEAGPLLSEGGFGVLLPPWWGRGNPLTAKVKVHPTKTSGGGLFGLSSLVEFDFEVALGDRALTREELEGLAELKVPLVRLRGQWVEVRPEDVRAALRALDERRKRGSTMSLQEALQASAGGTLEGLEVSEFSSSGWVDDLLRGLQGDRHLEMPTVPEDFAGTLRPYQLRGVAWLGFLRRFGLGACLADDMGLGKTVQTLVHLLRLREDGGGSLPGPVLLVCPTSVMMNWKREAERFAPSLRVLLHHGEGRDRRPPKAWPAPAELVITSYPILWRDEKLLASRNWDTIVLDEAQSIKNPAAQASVVARRLPARHRIALTGTPVENRLSELWSIMDFLNRGFLGGLESFRTDFARRIEAQGDGVRADALKRLVRPFILRRVKTDPKVAPDLPEKVEIREACTLTREQATLYEATVKDMMAKIASSDGMQRRGLVLSTLTKLKQICDHPALLLHDRSSLPDRSGKLDRIEEMLEEALEEGDKALVFTQYSEIGAMLRERFVERFGFEVPFLHGSVSAAERDRMVQQFQTAEGPPIFVLSLKAGGFGLNLTAANRVFHYDRWWNPAVENQATDRAFRIGQTRKVMVHKFTVSGTLEEKIELLLERKKGLAQDVLSTGEEHLTELSTQELRELFSLRAASPAGAMASRGNQGAGRGPVATEA